LFGHLEIFSVYGSDDKQV